MSCPSVNDSGTEDDCFFCSDGIHWDAHRIGWAVAGGCAALTTLITLFTTTMHARNYQYPPAQRQVLRILMMPCVYSIVSFLSYRYYQQFYYFEIGETVYESITLSAFLMLLMELVSLSNPDGMLETTLATKDKRKFPIPFCCVRFRASKPYFWHALSFAVMQYVVIRPLLSIAGIIFEYFNLLCPQEYSLHFAEVYLDSIDFASISVALYGLIIFYMVCKDELKGRKPLSKFLAIKLIVFFTFYQSFLFSILQEYGVIKSTALWTATNVANGLDALCTCVEMVFFSVFMGWAYSWKEYTNPMMNPQRRTSWTTYFQAIWDAVNVSDFASELYHSSLFFIAFIRGKPGTRSSHTKMQKTFMPDSLQQTKDCLPMDGLTSSTMNTPPRTHSPNTYQRLYEEQTTQPPKSNFTPNGEAFPVPQPSGYSLRDGSAPISSEQWSSAVGGWSQRYMSGPPQPQELPGSQPKPNGPDYYNQATWSTADPSRGGHPDTTPAKLYY